MSNNKFKILLVEDESNIRSFMEAELTANDYYVVSGGTCAQGLTLFASYIPDLVILDLGLPDMDGLEFIREARRTSPTPIIVLSARSGEHDKVAALDMGANDYITKPFGTEELMARVRAALRSQRGHSMSAIPGGQFVLYDLVIDYDSRLVSLGGQEIRLTRTEYNILVLLARNAGRIMTYASLSSAIWGRSDAGSIKRLQVNLANIRKKFGWKPGESRYLINELGIGYRMCVERNP